MRVLSALFLLLFTHFAHAEQEEALWDIGIGLSATHIPHYVGADEANDYLLPFPYLVYRGEKLKIDRNFIHGEFFSHGNWRAEWSMSGAPPVDSNDNDARAGMPDLDAIGEFGPVLMHSFISDDERLLRFEWPIRKAISTDFNTVDDRGFSSNPLLRFNQRWQSTQSRWLLESTLGPVYNSDAYNDYFYSVDPAYQTSDRAAFHASGGYSGWRFSLGLSRRQKNIWMGAFVRYWNLDDVVFDNSPLLRERDSWLFGVAVAWIVKSSNKTSQEWSCKIDDSPGELC